MSNTNITTTEKKYLAFLNVPRTTDEITAEFSVKNHAAWQMLRTLRLKKLVHEIKDGKKKYWKRTYPGDDVHTTSITEMNREYMDYMRTPRRIKDMMQHFNKQEQTVYQVVRTLSMMGYVSYERAAHPDARSFVWYITDAGLTALETVQ